MQKVYRLAQDSPERKLFFLSSPINFQKQEKHKNLPFYSLLRLLFTTNMFPSQSTLKKNFYIPSVAADSAPAPTGANLYARFAFAGAVCCAITHGAMTPVDVVKTRMQLSPEVYNKVNKKIYDTLSHMMTKTTCV